MTTPAEQFDMVLANIEGGMSLSDACRVEGAPDRTTVHRLIQNDEDFRNKYARACTARADVLFDEMFKIADNTEIGEKRKILSDGTEEITEGDMIEHRRLKIDVRKWALSKMNPKKYGEKLDVAGSLSVTIAKPDADW